MALDSERGRIRGFAGAWDGVEEDEDEEEEEEEEEEGGWDGDLEAAASRAASFAAIRSMEAVSRSRPRRRRMSTLWRDCAKLMHMRRKRECSRAVSLMRF